MDYLKDITDSEVGSSKSTLEQIVQTWVQIEKTFEPEISGEKLVDKILIEMIKDPEAQKHFGLDWEYKKDLKLKGVGIWAEYFKSISKAEIHYPGNIEKQLRKVGIKRSNFYQSINGQEFINSISAEYYISVYKPNQEFQRLNSLSNMPSITFICLWIRDCRLKIEQIVYGENIVSPSEQ